MSEFQDEAVAILAEYGYPSTISNRSGTVTATSVYTFRVPVNLSPDYWPEGGENAMDGGDCEILCAGNVTIGDGYKIANADGTYQVLADRKFMDGTTAAFYQLPCRRV